jgi:hypothetical protein
MSFRISRRLAMTVLAFLVGVGWLHAQAQGDDKKTPPVAVNVIRQGFPAAKADAAALEKSDTAWELEWDITNPNNAPGKKKENTRPSSVLVIRSAKFMFKDYSGQPRWFTVLKNLELGEIFVPYDRLEPVFLDVTEEKFHLLPAKKEYLGPSCVVPGEILGSPDARMHNKVIKEVHDDGLRWMNDKDLARRGEKMLVWALFHGGNYRYIIEYGFSDDGVITCRLGATGHNYFDKQKDQRDVHLHVGGWRWDPQLSEAGPSPVGGPAANRILLVRRVPRTTAPTGIFRIDVAPFSPNDQGQACEGFADWKAEEFTILRVQSRVRRNTSKDPQFTAYDLIPQRIGTARNYPWKYHFANHDFWVTRQDAKHAKLQEVPLYATGSKRLDKTAVTVWHTATAYHVPRGEDYGPEGSSSKNGAAMTSWASFVLRPVNLFDRSPLYP